MAEKDNDMSFSDDESENVGISSSVIAHKSMPEDIATPSPNVSDKGNENNDPKSLDNEPICPENEDNDKSNKYVEMSTDETEVAKSSTFEAISDDEDSSTKQNENIENATTDKADSPSNESDESANKTTEENTVEEATSPKYVDAPIPSPFSDIGDAENIIGTGTDDNELISDIMKDSKEADFNIVSTEQDAEVDLTTTTTTGDKEKELPSTEEASNPEKVQISEETPISDETVGASEEITTEEVATTDKKLEDTEKSQGKLL